MSDIHIAFGVTSDWIKYTFVTICSILCHAKKDDKYTFYIMSDTKDINFARVLYRLNAIKPANYRFIKMVNSEFNGAVHDWLGVSSSYRLKLSSIVKEDKILYLDSDIVVLKDISELYSYDVSDYYLGAVEDKWSVIMKPRAGLCNDDTFYNGGVQLMNLKKMRENNFESQVFDKLREIHYYTDQDVVNDICRKNILRLPLKYNLMPLTGEDNYSACRGEFLEAMKNPAILHFTDKPWDTEVNCGEHWHKYAKMIEPEIFALMRQGILK